jgi:two-component system chemotaxis response regulator CheB
VLTGNLDDGSAGLVDIKLRGGIASVQNPEEALAPSMPASALEAAEVDFVLPLADIGPKLRSRRKVQAQSRDCARQQRMRGRNGQLLADRP